MFEELYQKIKNTLISMSQETKYSKNNTWVLIQHKNDSVLTYNIKYTFLYSYFNKIKNQIKALSINEKIELARMLYISGYLEEQDLGLKIIEPEWRYFYENEMKLVKEFIKYINNWSSTDLFTLKIIQPILELYPSETLSLLSEWNDSPNIWEKRASLVAFTRRIASKKIYIEYLLKFSNNLLSENNDLIKKAIGWALKDNLRYSKHEIMSYIDSISKKEGTSKIINYALKEIRKTQKETER